MTHGERTGLGKEGETKTPDMSVVLEQLLARARSYLGLQCHLMQCHVSRFCLHP